MVGAQRLELKIKQLEDSLEKRKINSKISTRNQSIDYFAGESIEVSCSSEDSLSILREQVDFAKNLGTELDKGMHPVVDNFPEALSHVKMSFCSEIPQRRVIRHKSITDFAFLNAIPIINLN